MSNLFEALKRLERQEAQPENPFNQGPGQAKDTRTGLKRLFTRPYGIWLGVLAASVLLGFVTLLAMDWYLKQPMQRPVMPVQHHDSTPQTPPKTNSQDMPAPVETSQSAPSPASASVPSEPQETQTMNAPLGAAPQPTAKTDTKDLPVSAQRPKGGQKAAKIAASEEVRSQAGLKANEVSQAQGPRPDSPIQASDQESKALAGAHKGPDAHIQIQTSPVIQEDTTRWRKNLLEQAETLRKERRFKEAAVLYEKVWKDSQNAAVANNLAAAYLAAGAPQEALNVLKEAAKIAPQDEDIQYNMEVAQMMLMNFQR